MSRCAGVPVKVDGECIERFMRVLKDICSRFTETTEFSAKENFKYCLS